MAESRELKNGEQFQLCDANGRTLGVFLAPETVQQMNAERERLAKEADELRKQLEETQRQRDAWMEKARHSEERAALLEQDWHSMFRLLPRELQITEEEIREIQRNPHTFEEVLDLFTQRKSS